MKKYILSLLMFFVALSSFSVNVSDFGKAKWIWLQEDGQPNSWVAFRKTFTLDSAPGNVKANIAVDTKYWLWINGQMVLFEGGLARGAAPNTCYYDEVDLSSYLQKGENTISILVWYWGRTRKTHEDSGKGGLIFHSDIDGYQLCSDSSWKVIKHPGYDPKSGGGGGSANRVNAYNIRFDANKALGDWTDAAWYSLSYNDTKWNSAIEKGLADCLPWGKLVPRCIPQWNDRGLADYVSLKTDNGNITLPYINNTGKVKVISAKLPFNRQVTPYLKIRGVKGDTITVDTDDPFNLLQSVYITKDGVQEFEGYSWFNGHNIEYSIPSGVEVLELKYRWTGLGEMPGNFECSDEQLTRLWWMARNTLYICARDSYMDCPDRERGLWIGDVADQTGAVFYTLDDAGIKLLKKAIDNTIAYRNDSIIQGLAPGFGDYRGKSSELTGQSLQFISQGIWQYYYNTGDKETLANAYPAVMDYMRLWNMMPDGLPMHRKGYANWVDWGTDSDPVPTNVILYYMALKAVKSMASVLEKISDVEWCNGRIENIEKCFSRKYWRGTHYGTAGKPLEERVSALAVISGLADKDNYQILTDSVLFPVRKSSPHMEWMVEEALILTGNHEKGLQRMKERYAPQILDKELTTLYERFDEKRPGTPNHAWNAPNYVLSRYISGIKATDVAWKSFEVRPYLTTFASVNQIVPSVKGNIVLKAEKDNSSCRIELKSPEGTVAKVYIPLNGRKLNNVTVNGKTVWKNGETIASSKDECKFVGKDDDSICYEVGCGDWSFVVQND